MDPAYGSTYGAENVIDGRLDTAWVEGASDVGIGESVTIRADTYQEVHGVKLHLGYQKSAERFAQNGYPTKVRITTSDGTTFDASQGRKRFTQWFGNFSGFCYNINPRFAYDGETDCFVSFGSEILTDSITVTILDAAPGGVGRDVCISEIIPY